MTEAKITKGLNTWKQISQIWRTFDTEYFNNTLDKFEIKEFYGRENDNPNIDMDIFFLQNKDYDKHYNKDSEMLTGMSAKDIKIESGIKATFMMLGLSARCDYTIAVWVYAFVHDIKKCCAFTGNSNNLLNEIVEACEMCLEADDYLQWDEHSTNQFPVIYNMEEIMHLSQCESISLKEIIFLAIMNTYLFVTNNTVIACEQNSYGI